MCAAGAMAPSLMIAGTSSDTMTMYEGVVGMPMPRTMPATAVSTSAATSELCASTTNWVKVIPRPVIVTEPMTMPAQAQAIATDSVLRAPSTSASKTFRQPMCAFCVDGLCRPARAVKVCRAARCPVP